MNGALVKGRASVRVWSVLARLAASNAPAPVLWGGRVVSVLPEFPLSNPNALSQAPFVGGVS